MDTLSEHHTQLVAEFKGITDTSEDDHDKIIRLLDIHDWNLNNAILAYFDSGFIDESAVPEPIGPGASPGPGAGTSSGIDSEEESHLHSRRYSTLADSFEMSDLIPKLPFAPRISNNWQLDIGINASLHHQNNILSPRYQSTTLKTINSIWFILLFIPNKLFTVLYHIFRYFFNVNRENFFPSSVDYEAIDLDYKLPMPPLDRQVLGLDPETPELNEKTEKSGLEKSGVDGVDSQYNLHYHDFNSVYETCRTNYQWLLVILVNDSPESTNFYQSLLTNKSFSQLFNKTLGQFNTTNIFINNAIKNPESFQVGKTYKTKRLPYLMLINNVTNNPNVMASMAITYKSNISSTFLTGSNLPGTVNKIITNLKKIINHYNPQVISALADKREIEISRQLKEFQDSAYEKSLQADKQKKQKKDEEMKKQQLEKCRKQYLLHLITSKWFDKLNVGNIKPLRIQIKLPHGQNLKLSITNPQITIYELYLYVELKLYVQQLIEDETTEFESEQDVLDHPESMAPEVEKLGRLGFGFELVQPYPKKVYEEYDDVLTEHLKSGDSLLVEYTGESESDSDSDSEE